MPSDPLQSDVGLIVLALREPHSRNGPLPAVNLYKLLPVSGREGGHRIDNNTDQHAWKCKVRSPRSWRVGEWPELCGVTREGSLGQVSEGEGTERAEPYRPQEEEGRNRKPGGQPDISGRTVKTVQNILARTCALGHPKPLRQPHLC